MPVLLVVAEPVYLSVRVFSGGAGMGQVREEEERGQI